MHDVSFPFMQIHVPSRVNRLVEGLPDIFIVFATAPDAYTQFMVHTPAVGYRPFNNTLNINIAFMVNQY
jgi:hypothetical protein